MDNKIYMSRLLPSDVFVWIDGKRYIVIDNFYGVIAFRDNSNKSYAYNWKANSDHRVTIITSKNLFKEPTGWDVMTIEHFLGVIGA